MAADGPTVWDMTAGGICGLLTIFTGWLHARLNKIEDGSDALDMQRRNEFQSANDRLWTAFEEHRRDQAAFRERVLTAIERKVTVDDLRASEQRILSAMAKHGAD